MKANEKGFSLVELVVSMAILMIVGVAMLGFMAYCINQYTRSSEETTLQMETQTTQSQVQELILQTNVGIAINSVKVNGERGNSVADKVLGVASHAVLVVDNVIVICADKRIENVFCHLKVVGVDSHLQHAGFL